MPHPGMRKWAYKSPEESRRLQALREQIDDAKNAIIDSYAAFRLKGEKFDFNLAHNAQRLISRAHEVLEEVSPYDHIRSLERTLAHVLSRLAQLA